MFSSASLRFHFSVVPALLLAVAATAHGAQTTPQLGIRSKTPDARAFINARIVVSPEQTFDSATLLIRDGHVVAAGKNVSVPEGVMTIDLAGKIIYPGFIDPFTDYGVEKTEKPQRRWGRRPKYETERVGGNAWNEAIHAHQNWSVLFKPVKKEYEELMKLGFATVLTHKKDGIFRGRAAIVLLGEGLPNDLLIRPYASPVASFDKGTSTQDYPSSRMGAIALIRQTFYDVEWYQQAHRAFDLNPNQELPEFNAAIEALADVHTAGLVFDGGADRLSLFQAQRIAAEFELPLVVVGSGREYARIADVKAAGVTLVLPLDFPPVPSVEALEDQLDVTLADLRHWEMAPSNAALLESHDIPFSLTTHRLKKVTDFWPNLRQAIKRGLSPATALAALTTVPAEICGVSDLTGSLEPGKLANFFVCDGDIFREKVTIYSVWVAGKMHEVTPLPTTDFAGEYELSVAGRSMTLSLTGKPANLKGSLKKGDWKERLQNVTVERNKISFAAELDTTDTAGLARFSGRKVADTINGECLLGDGSVVDWTAVWVGPASTEEDTADAKGDREAEPDSLLSRLTFPNKAFGFATPPETENVLIKNATVWTLEPDGVLANADVLIVDGKFRRVGRNLDAPSGVRVIDAAGKHLTPGIIDAHSHIGIDGNVNEGTHAISSEVRIGDVIDPDDISIYRQLAGGVTACLTMHGSANPIGGQTQVIKHRWGATAEGLKFAEAPRTIKFALGENVKQSNWGDQYRIRYPQTRMGVQEIIRDEFQAAREYEAAWKKYRSLPAREQGRTIAPRRNLRLDAIVEVLNSERDVHCHAYAQSEILMLMRLAEEYGIRIRAFQHVLEGYKVADEMAAHGAGGSSFSDWWAYKFEVYDAIPYSPALMTERGVVTTVNSDDADLARRLNQEAGKSIMYGGLDSVAALKLVTLNAAKLLRVDHLVGSIRPGKDADFVIWSANPLSVSARAEQTWIEGRKYFDTEFDQQMRLDLEREKNALIQKALRSPSSGDGKKREGNRKGPYGSQHHPLQEGTGP